jgi:hypothetical protein
MYSDTSKSDHNCVSAFLTHVLDPQPIGINGGYQKADFLRGQTFLENVKFPGWAILHDLIEHLAFLFAVRYEQEPSPDEWKVFHSMERYVKATDDSDLAQLHHKSKAYLHQQRVTALQDHNHVIKLFTTALEDRSEWPDDCPVKQCFTAPGKPGHCQVTKTGWNTTALMVDLGIADDRESNETDSGGEDDDQY